MDLLESCQIQIHCNRTGSRPIYTVHMLGRKLLLSQTPLRAPKIPHNHTVCSHVRERKLNPNFFSSFSGTRDIPPKSLVSLGFEGHTELSGPHPFTWKTPTPPENIRTKTSLAGEIKVSTSTVAALFLTMALTGQRIAMVDMVFVVFTAFPYPPQGWMEPEFASEDFLWMRLFCLQLRSFCLRFVFFTFCGGAVSRKDQNQFPVGGNRKQKRPNPISGRGEP